MRITITPDEMKALELQYMKETAVPGALLMEHAAQAVCRALAGRIPGGRALFLCGGGNNGGDGYAAARLWRAAGGQAVVMELTSALTGDAAMNRTLALQCGVTVLPASPALPDCDAIVDALFGTGLSRPVEGVALAWIRAMNASDVPVIAVDIPSGLHGGTGCALGEAVLAAETVTFHRIKQGLLLRDGPRHAGKITVADILIPADYGPQQGMLVMDAPDAALPPRPADAHKGTFGRVVILAGSEGMAGAAAFCAAACVKSGAGLTQVVCPREVLPVVQVLAPGATCIPLDQADLPALLHGASAAVAGCGLGQAETLLPMLHALRHASCPVVWDADALNLLALHRELLPLPQNAVITPHPGEAARLLHCSTAQVTDDPLRAVHALQKLCGCTVLLKGARSLIADGQQIAVNPTGSPALAKGGSGDVLSGMLGALLAGGRCSTAFRAVQTGAWQHGRAGERAAQALGEDCLTPSALIDAIRMD